MTKEEWFSLKVGEFVRTSTPIPRRILNIKNGCITLKALHKTKWNKPNTIYAKNDRRLFTKVDKGMCDACCKHDRNEIYL